MIKRFLNKSVPKLNMLEGKKPISHVNRNFDTKLYYNKKK